MIETPEHGILDLLEGLDEVTERLGGHKLANGLSVEENNQAVLALIAALTMSAAQSAERTPYPSTTGRISIAPPIEAAGI